MGYHEQLWLENYDETRVLFYRRYVDDTFCVFHNEHEAMFFLDYCSVGLLRSFRFIIPRGWFWNENRRLINKFQSNLTNLVQDVRGECEDRFSRRLRRDLDTYLEELKTMIIKKHQEILSAWNGQRVDMKKDSVDKLKWAINLSSRALTL